MAIKNFVFRQNRVGRKVAGMKKTTFCPQKDQIMNSLNRILVEKDRNYIITNFMTLRLTN